MIHELTESTKHGIINKVSDGISEWRDYEMANISVDWNVFNYKFSGNTRAAFESFAYTLFCFEFNQKYGIFRYFNQPFIETLPIITDDGDVIGFQAKYYDETIRLSSKKGELIEAINGAKSKYLGITKFIIYTNKELSASNIKGKVKPDYQIEIEDHGKNLGIQVEWRVTSNFEIMLLNPKLSAVIELYFNPDSELQRFAENIQNRTTSIISSIKSNILFKDITIKIDYPQTPILDFIQSEKKVFVVYGDAGTGKSGYVKDFSDCIFNRQDSSLLVFSATDFDAQDEIYLLKQFGNYNLEDLFSLYDSDDNKYCIIESAEKYSNFRNYDVLRTVILKFLKHGWKLIFTIRKQYKEGFINSILDGIIIDEFSIKSIEETRLRAISKEYVFDLPLNNKLCDLLCNLFYLKLYLQLLSSGITMPSDTKSFTNQIWKQVVRNESERRNNLPVRRETFILLMASTMLRDEKYIYNAKATDDTEAISLLEAQGIISPYNDIPGLWTFNHDVYEEIIVTHIFDSKYDTTQELNLIISEFNNSLRSRKMYRIWLEAKLREPDDNLLFAISGALGDSHLFQSWKDETMIALMNSENDEAFKIMESLFSSNGYALFTRAVFLLNTACKCINRNKKFVRLIQDKKSNSYRFTDPTGKAWHTIFSYIYKYQSLIPWNNQNINIVIEAMKSWVNNNPKGKTTSLIGHTALLLKDRFWEENKRQYGLYNDTIYIAVNNIITLTAIEIKDELSNIIDKIICSKSFSHRDKDYVFLKKVLSNIFECGTVCVAIPKKILQLAWGYWLYNDENDHFSSPDMESYFGFNDHLNLEYFPSSAYQTSMCALLQTEPMQSIDFIIKLTNYAAANYKESRLNENDSECCEIQIVLSDKQIVKQICSERLWKIHRGTSVAPHLLESILMALEDYLLLYVDLSTKEDATSKCIHLLEHSNNVAITAVVLSAVIAYPDKLFDVSCVLLKTKELFMMDRLRFQSEQNANYFKRLNTQHKRFDDERISSNKKEFRKKKFEDIILNYQVNSGNLSENIFKERLEKLYTAIDNATTKIEKMSPIYQSYYYNIDLRKYKLAGDPIVEEDRIGVPIKPDLPQKVIDYAKSTGEIYDKVFGNIELMLWSSLRYKGDEKYKDYRKYEDNPILAYQSIKEILESDEKLPLLSTDTIVYTTAVLLRDYLHELNEEQTSFCKNTLFELGFVIVKDSSSLLLSNDVKNAIITEIANFLGSSFISFEWDNPAIILLAFMLDYHKHLRNSMIKPLSGLWENNDDLAKKLIFAFTKLIQLYDGKDVITFVESHKNDINDFLTMDLSSLETMNINNLDYNTLIYINSLLDCCDESILNFVIKLGKRIWKMLFNDNLDKNTQRIFELEYEYKRWLAEYLLNISDNQRMTLIHELMPFVTINREFNSLLSEVVMAETINSRYDAFWNLWLSIQDYIFQVFEKKVDDYKNVDLAVNIGYGFEDVLVTFLLGNPFWGEGVTEWHSLKTQNSIFYTVVAKRLGYNPTTLFSITKVLYTVGKNLFKEDGINWLSDIIRNNPHLYKKPLPENTLFYIEEYIFSYVKEHATAFQTNLVLKKKAVIVLDFLVERGSTMGFLLREEII